jgi:hypothetical protein
MLYEKKEKKKNEEKKEKINKRKEKKKIQCCPIRWSGYVFPTKAEGTFNSLGSLFLA